MSVVYLRKVLGKGWAPQLPVSHGEMKEFCFLACEVCRGFLGKVLAPTLPGSRRTKIGEITRQIFAAFFVHVGEEFRQSFALGAFVPKAGM